MTEVGISKLIERLIVIIIVAIIVVVAYPRLTGNQTSTENTRTEIETEIVKKTYSIEKINSEWMMVKVDIGQNWNRHSIKAFAEGLKELAREYKIVSVTPIHRYYYDTAPTGALLVEVAPRYQ